MVAINAGLKVNWAQILFQVLLNMVKTPKRQSQGFAIQVSALLQHLVKENLGTSVKLHSQKVLTSKSVQTYIKRNTEIKATGESSKQNEDTASNTEGGESQGFQSIKKVKIVNRKKKSIPAEPKQKVSTQSVEAMRQVVKRPDFSQRKFRNLGFELKDPKISIL
ncbi:peroxisome biogenesis protein 6-like [Dorcoceras hygrometricum]|uniref:Peroxisome biogenesis protein 6-like n=1 Tax=Dorcoceras hygrometricum TaxID=472368 RepID=A0A2Z7CE37_9LAMI|nr:peroxisome biogenesis protein 6-like [Dorcoceras hygrometricum]